MLIKLSTDKSISEVASALPVSAQANRFGVMQVHNLKERAIKAYLRQRGDDSPILFTTRLT